MTFAIDLYGLEIQLSCDNPTVIDYVERELGSFASDSNRGPPRLYLSARHGPSRMVPRDTEASLITVYSTSYTHGNLVYTDYQGRGMLVYDTVEQIAELSSEDPRFLATMVIAVILEKAREFLPAHGIYLFPWLSIAAKGLAFLFLMYPGGGKTTLTVGLLETPKLELLGDSFTVISRNGKIRPFPRSIHLRGAKTPHIPDEMQIPFVNLIHEPRVSIDPSYFRHRFAVHSDPFVMFVCKRVASDTARIVKLPKWRAVFHIYRQIRVKSELQGAMNHLVPSSRKPRIQKWSMAMGRALIAMMTLWKSKTYLIYLGLDSSNNLRTIKEFIEEMTGERPTTQ